MKKSELYRLAACAVIGSQMAAMDKVDVLEVLFDDCRMAKWDEEHEEKVAQE